MRLARHGSAGQERPIISGSDGVWRDLTPVTDDITPTFLTSRLPGLSAPAVADLAPVANPDRFGPPLAHPGKIACIGLNYRDHAAETAADIPDEPIVFLKT